MEIRRETTRTSKILSRSLASCIWRNNNTDTPTLRIQTLTKPNYMCALSWGECEYLYEVLKIKMEK